MASVSAPAAGQCVVLEDIDWRTYSRLPRAFGERPPVRLTYDRGTLEMMSPLHEHESNARFLGRLAVTLTEELGLTVKAGGSTTFRRRRRRRGLEPEDCYWIANEPRVRGKRHIDLRVGPPLTQVLPCTGHSRMRTDQQFRQTPLHPSYRDLP